MPIIFNGSSADPSSVRTAKASVLDVISNSVVAYPVFNIRNFISPGTRFALPKSKTPLELV